MGVKGYAQAIYNWLYTGMDKLVCTPASTALFACGCVQVIPAYPPGGDTSAGSFGNGRFLISRPRLRIPVLCDVHARLFRVTSVFTK